MEDLFLFVYGSLRRDGAGRHHPMLREAEFLGDATTGGRLYRVSWHPGLHPDKTAGEVTGELFRIPAAIRPDLVRALDAHEGPGFELRRVPVHLADGSTRSGYTYAWLGDASQAAHLADGDFGIPADHPGTAP